jgi:hypothetical protein
VLLETLEVPELRHNDRTLLFVKREDREPWWCVAEVATVAAVAAVAGINLCVLHCRHDL